MAEHDEIVSTVVRELSSIRGLKPSIEKVTESSRLLFGADQAGVTLIQARGELVTVGPTDEIVTKLDSLQYELHQGPCVDAATEQHIVVSNDLGADSRWPAWGPQARARGVHSMLAADLQADGKRIGALNLYGSRVDQFADTDGALLVSFSAHASAALAAAHTIESLTSALDTRTVIGQAEGIIMERFGVDEVTAFAILKRYSQDSNTRLREIADQIVATRQLPTT
ncbi:GAF and ANTAR domain-containing protein [Mumia zhuanghuii]|uniref:GAF and ANTAR domain-containing protein n=2 Tax=Mumia TaxID=1546255 RepID=A0ABW1QUC1_9ACTN|nr:MULTISPECIES: GAF and ANTAR domain-containing protein [Mumia]KAA1422957.1 GAF and ANTAR domain-containing protein [Mumia zhuanghuii]